MRHEVPNVRYKEGSTSRQALSEAAPLGNYISREAKLLLRPLPLLIPAPPVPEDKCMICFVKNNKPPNNEGRSAKCEV